MDIPYGFDCYAFSPNEVKYFDTNIKNVKSNGIVPYNKKIDSFLTEQEGYVDPKTGSKLPGYIRFTRKNEDYTTDQLISLVKANRLNQSDSSIDRKVFCGIKIQIGIGVVTNFLNKGLQYRKPNKGRSELINGTWNGIVSGLTVDRNAPNSYDIAFGNFLAYDEEFPYIKFGPFFAIESKLVMLTGSSRSIEASSFGTNIQSKIWYIILFLMIILSLLASFRVHWQHTKHKTIERVIKKLFSKYLNKHINNFELSTTSSTNLNQNHYYSIERTDSLPIGNKSIDNSGDDDDDDDDRNENVHKMKDLGEQNLTYMLHNFFFIYFTMLLNKPSLEFDDFIWPKHDQHLVNKKLALEERKYNNDKGIQKLLEDNKKLKEHYNEMLNSKRKRKPLPTTIRIVSYIWSAACLVMASIYSGEMLAVILLHSDQNIDTIQQLISSKPPIEPVIRQDDFTYNLMLKSLDKNMLLLHNKTKIIPRPEVYTRTFIESVSERKQALLGDDELIETIYDIYHKYFPLYRSKVTYLQYPISIMYRNDLNKTLEKKLRRGMVQIFEMGLIGRWYQAQKETYINFYDNENKQDKTSSKLSPGQANSDAKYKPLSMHHFESFFRLMFFCILSSILVLILELLHYYILKRRRTSLKVHHHTDW